MKLSVVAVLAGLLLTNVAGCQKGAESGPVASPSQPAAPSALPAASTASAASPAAEAQIRAAIEDHLEHTSSLNLKAFDTDVKQVTVQGDHAEAQVDFHIKGGPGVMQLVYQLQNRQGTWAVTDSNPVGGDFSHPAAGQGQAPGAGVPGGNSHSLSDTLRSFKQDGAGAPPELPANHPPLSNTAPSYPQ